ncbi:MAG TPA: class II aldolase/adducin family protein [Anaerolineaceae bacterium]|nr:class II aldolase/adducin family protein [Anaerolineaceae bacterium]
MENQATLETILTEMGEAGKRMCEINASEGAAGNLSVYVAWPLKLESIFPLRQQVTLQQPAQRLIGGTFIVSGSGCRLRDIHKDPAANLGALTVNPDGVTGVLHTSARCAFARLTSEFNSHFGVHCDQVTRNGYPFHAIVHAQPVHLTYLSHIPRYRETAFLNERLMRWQPEMVISLAGGLDVLPFQLPGSAELMSANIESLQTHPLVVWSKHGVMARSEQSVLRACDRVEYAETAAHYEVLNLSCGEPANGLSEEESRRIAKAFGAH